MTETTPAVVDDDTYTVTRTVLIRAHRSAVWEAITTPELMTEWFGEKAEFSSVSVGVTGTIGWDAWGDSPVEIVEVDEPTAFAYRWGQNGKPISDDTATLVRFTLDDDVDGTRLTLVETGFNAIAGSDEHRRKRADENRKGWDAELDELVAFLEKQDSQ
jgi:uncharacterized protein YndB with AHSA1/START domain